MKPVLAFCCALLLTPAALAAETLKYVALVDGGKQAGEQTVVTGDDGSITEWRVNMRVSFVVS